MILTAAGTRGVARTYCEIHEFNAPARSRTTRSPTAHSSSSTRDGAHRPPVWRGPRRDAITRVDLANLRRVVARSGKSRGDGSPILKSAF
jgi:hypothetical protein